jgi:hypothetical protein
VLVKRIQKPGKIDRLVMKSFYLVILIKKLNAGVLVMVVIGAGKILKMVVSRGRGLQIMVVQDVLVSAHRAQQHLSLRLLHRQVVLLLLKKFILIQFLDLVDVTLVHMMITGVEDSMAFPLHHLSIACVRMQTRTGLVPEGRLLGLIINV